MPSFYVFNVFAYCLRKYTPPIKANIIGLPVIPDSRFISTAYVLPLARDHADANNPDILWDLSTIYLPKLFSDNTKQTDEFKLLMNKLDDLAQKARKLVGQTGGINSEERFKEYKAYGEELMKILKDHISGLLWQEQFFKAVFPAE